MEPQSGLCCCLKSTKMGTSHSDSFQDHHDMLESPTFHQNNPRLRDNMESHLDRGMVCVSFKLFTFSEFSKIDCVVIFHSSTWLCDQWFPIPCHRQILLLIWSACNSSTRNHFLNTPPQDVAILTSSLSLKRPLHGIITQPDQTRRTWRLETNGMVQGVPKWSKLRNDLSSRIFPRRDNSAIPTIFIWKSRTLGIRAITKWILITRLPPWSTTINPFIYPSWWPRAQTARRVVATPVPRSKTSSKRCPLLGGMNPGVGLVRCLPSAPGDIILQMGDWVVPHRLEVGQITYLKAPMVVPSINIPVGKTTVWSLQVPCLLNTLSSFKRSPWYCTNQMWNHDSTCPIFIYVMMMIMSLLPWTNVLL